MIDVHDVLLILVMVIVLIGICLDNREKQDHKQVKRWEKEFPAMSDEEIRDEYLRCRRIPSDCFGEDSKLWEIKFRMLQEEISKRGMTFPV